MGVHLASDGVAGHLGIFQFALVGDIAIEELLCRRVIRANVVVMGGVVGPLDQIDHRACGRERVQLEIAWQ